MVVCEYANRLKKKGIKVIIASCDGTKDLSWFVGHDVETRGWLEIKADVCKDYDAVVATGWITAYTAAESGIERAYYFVQSDERRFYPAESYLRKRVEDTYRMNFKFITIADWLVNWLKNEFSVDAFLVRNGLDKNIFNTGGQKLSKRPDDKIRILIEGAIDLPFKQVPEALELASKLPEDQYEIWLVSSSGDPNPSWKIERYFSKISQRMMGDVYRSCHVLLKLSRVEGMSGPPLEAMACGCVPIISKVTGSSEYLIDGKNGFYFDSQKDSLQDVFKNAMDLQKSPEFSNSANETVEKFDWEISTDRMVNILLSQGIISQ